MTGSTLDIPEAFARSMAEVHGEEGRRWVERLPDLVAACAERWSLTVGAPYALSYNYVAPAVRADGATVVLKAGVPHSDLLNEMEALRLLDGDGAVRLLGHDRAWGAMVLERLEPGTPLASLATEDDERATAIAAAMMRRLWRPAPVEHPFPTVADWAGGLARLRARYDGGAGPLPGALVGRAEALFAELLASPAEPRLLHGDLHHDNILAAGREPWLAIDAKGLVGDPGFELGAFLLNPWGEFGQMADAVRLLERRVWQLADELAMDRRRIRAWGQAFAVLSAWWSLEDHGHGWEYAIGCAELFDAVTV